VHGSCILDDNHVLALHAAVAKLGDCTVRVREQAFLVRVVNPCSRNHARPITRADLVFVRVDQRIERVTIDEAFLDQ
jgi:hypothetical protein